MELKSMVQFILALVSTLFCDTKTMVVETAQEVKKASLKEIVTGIVLSLVDVCSNVAFLAIFTFALVFVLTAKTINKLKALSTKAKSLKRKIVMNSKDLAKKARLQLAALVEKTKANSRFIYKTVKSNIRVLSNKTQSYIISYANTYKRRLVSFCTATKQFMTCSVKINLLTPCKVTKLILAKAVDIKRILIETCNSIKSFGIVLVNCTFIKTHYRVIESTCRFINPMTPVPVYKREPDS